MHKSTKNRTKQSLFLIVIFFMSLMSLSILSNLSMNPDFFSSSSYELIPEISALGHLASTIIDAILFSF